MATIYAKLGEKIRRLRKEKRLSQENLAELVKTDVRTIVAIENGSRNPTLKTVNKIARALEITVSELLRT